MPEMMQLRLVPLGRSLQAHATAQQAVRLANLLEGQWVAMGGHKEAWNGKAANIGITLPRVVQQSTPR